MVKMNAASKQRIRNFGCYVTLLQKKKSVQKNSFCRGGASNAQLIKRRNWENVKMFGPLLQSSNKFRNNKPDRSSNVEVIDADCVEAGFQDLDAPYSSSKITSKKLLSIEMYDIFTGRESERSQIPVCQSSKLKTSDSPLVTVEQIVKDRNFCFPGNMFNAPDLALRKKLRQKLPVLPNIRNIPESSSPLENDSVNDEGKEREVKKRSTLPNNLVEHRDKSADLIDCIANFPYTHEAKVAAIGERMARLWQELGVEHQFPSVSTVLQKTMPEDSVKMLEKWKNSMIEKLGAEGFLKYQQETLYLGTRLHSNIAEFLHGRAEEDIEIDERNKGHWKSIRSALEKVSDVQLLEERVRHPYLHYCGSIDCVAKHLGTVVLIEWKTSQKPKPLLNSMYDNPIQVAAYLGALNSENKLNSQIERALVVVAYPSGTKAHVHYMSNDVCRRYWKLWLERLELYFRTHVIKL